jgi:crossover junction endonuclease MUS81
MDNREIHSQVDRDRLEREIGEAGIPYSVKALDVGDALWVAKSGGEEYVLDYIIERKRMDDLVNSITDGRFHEQKVPNSKYPSCGKSSLTWKFRLMKSGMRHVIYIIEDFAGFDRPEFIEAINTAISSSQTVNNFFVKRVKNIQETIGYLQRMSTFLTKLHRVSLLHPTKFAYKENRTLTIIPESQIDTGTFYHLKTSLARPNTYHCIPYETFAAIASKSASLNIGDVYLKMLMSIKGISAEKAIEIQKHFPTLNELVKTLEGLDEGEGKMIIAERCAKYGRRKIGNVLSGKIYEVFKPSR